MPDAHKNFAYSTVATAPSPATTGTSLVVQSADGSLFPTPPFNATVWPTGTKATATNAEIVRVTNISTDTLTITREQEGTSARSIVIGDQIAATITTKILEDAEKAIQSNVTQSSHGFAVGDVVRFNGTNYVKAQANSAANAEVVGIVSALAGVNDFTLQMGGLVTGLSGLTAGITYFLDPDTAGALTATEPTTVGEVSKPLLVADSTTSGYLFNFRGLVVSAANTAVPDPIADIFGAADTAYEFDTSSLSGLTALGTPDVENADTTIPGAYFVADNASGVAWCGRYATAPSAPFTAITHLLGANVVNNYNGAGIFIGQATPGNLDTIHWADAARYVQSAAWTATTFVGSESHTSDHLYPLYFAIRVNSGTDVDFLWSSNGYVWYEHVNARNPGYTIGSVGIAIVSQNTTRLGAAFDFLRIFNSALTFPGVA